MLQEKLLIKKPNSSYITNINMDLQDINYLDFELMKDCIGRMDWIINEKIPKKKILEEIKKKYNNQSGDIVDHYIIVEKLKKKPDITNNNVIKSYWKKIFIKKRKFLVKNI